MRSGVFLIGISLLTIGVILFISGSNGVNEYQTTVGQVYRAFSSSGQKEYATYRAMTLFGGIMGIIGFVVTLISFSGGKDKKSNEFYTNYSQSSKANRCSKCGTELDLGWRLCPNCLEPIGKNVCPYCSRPIKAEWRLCPYCGKSV